MSNHSIGYAMGPILMHLMELREKKLISDEKKFEKLKTVIMSNLNGLEKYIKYNIENNRSRRVYYSYS